MAEHLSDIFGRFRSWTYFVGISDHKAIILDLDLQQNHNFYSFKFNPGWLLDDSFCDLVHEQWAHSPQQVGSSLQSSLGLKLAHLRGVVIKWDKLKKAQDVEQLASIESEIQSIMASLDDSLFSEYARLRLLH